MNNHMSLKLVGANSSLELNSPITSIYLQEELTGLTTLPGIRETKGMNIGMDGGWTSAQFYEPRLITIKGVIANQDVAVVEQRRKQLIQLLAEKRLALEFQTEAGNHYTMNVVVAGVQMPLSKVLTASYFQISLRADDPLIYDNNALAELEAILRRSSSASSGFTINFPINFQLGTSESRPTIDNFGSSVIYPVITLTGPLTTPEIVNITTNMAFTIDEVLGAGTYTASGIRGAMTQEGSIDAYSGNPIQVTRDAESPISKFSLYGDATQTAYSGKNLFTYANSTHAGQMSITSDDNSATMTGTATGGSAQYIIVVVHVDATKTYNLSGIARKDVKDSGSGHALRVVQQYSDDGTTFSGWNDIYYNTNPTTGTNYSFSGSFSGHEYYRFYIYNILGSPTATGEKSTYYQMQLEQGSTKTDFEPYVGGISAPNYEFPMPISTTTGKNTTNIAGKNLLGILSPTRTNTRYGVTVTLADDGMITLNGTATGNQWPDLIYGIEANTVAHSTTAIPYKESTVVMSAKVVGGTATNTGNAGVSVYYNNDGNKSTLIKYTDMSATPAAAPTRGINRAFLYIPNGAVFDNYSFYLQVETGSQASQFEPYQAQEFEANLGKNLFHLTETRTDQAQGITIEMSENHSSFTLNGTNTGAAFARQIVLTSAPLTLKAGSYAMQVIGLNNNGDYVDRFYIAKASSIGTPILSCTPSNNWKGTFTLSEDTEIAAQIVVASSTSYSNQTIAIQIEKGSQPTDYQEYFTPIELAKIGDYQDRIYKSDGKWYIEKQVGKITFDGNTAWTKHSTAAGNVFLLGNTGFIGYAYGAHTKAPALMDIATVGALGEFADSAYSIFGINNGSQLRVFMGTYDSSYTADVFKTDMVGHYIYGALTTPTTTEITEQALINQLDAILEAHLYEGLNNISNVAISPNLAGDLEIKTGQTLTVINSLSIVGSSGSAEIDLGGSELAMVGSVADELTINGTTGAVTKTARIGKIESYAGETITTDYISTSGGLDSDATIYYVLPSSSTSVINTLDSTALAAFNGVVASGGVSAQTNIGSISVDVTTVTAQDVAVVDTKQHTVTINGVGAYSKFSGDWLTLDVGLNELQLITENNTDTGSAVIKYRVGYMGV